jgi:hypothetical protein
MEKNNYLKNDYKYLYFKYKKKYLNLKSKNEGGSTLINDSLIKEYQNVEDIYKLLDLLVDNISKLQADKELGEVVFTQKMREIGLLFKQVIEINKKIFDQNGVEIFVYSLKKNYHPQFASMAYLYLDVFDEHNYKDGTIFPLDYLKKKIMVLQKVKDNKTEYVTEYIRLIEIYNFLLRHGGIKKFESTDLDNFVADFKTKYYAYQISKKNKTVYEKKFFYILCEYILYNIDISKSLSYFMISFAIEELDVEFLEFLIKDLGLSTHGSYTIKKLPVGKKSINQIIDGKEDTETIKSIKNVLTLPEYVFDNEKLFFEEIFNDYFKLKIDKTDFPTKIIGYFNKYNIQLNFNMMRSDGHLNLILQIAQNYNSNEIIIKFISLLKSLRSIDIVYFNFLHFAVFFQDFVFINILLDLNLKNLDLRDEFIYGSETSIVKKPVLYFLLENKIEPDNDSFQQTFINLIEKSSEKKGIFINQRLIENSESKEDCLTYLISKRNEWISLKITSDFELFYLIKIILNTKEYIPDQNLFSYIESIDDKFKDQFQEMISYQILKLRPLFNKEIPNQLLKLIYLNINRIDDESNIFKRDWRGLNEFITKNPIFLEYSKTLNEEYGTHNLEAIRLLSLQFDLDEGKDKKPKSKKKKKKKPKPELVSDETKSDSEVPKDEIKSDSKDEIKSDSKVLTKSNPEVMTNPKLALEETKSDLGSEVNFIPTIIDPYLDLSPYWRFLTEKPENPVVFKDRLDKVDFDSCESVKQIFTYYQLSSKRPPPKELHPYICKIILILGYLSKFIKFDGENGGIKIIFKGGKAIQAYKPKNPSNDIDIMLLHERHNDEYTIEIGKQIINFLTWYFKEELEFQISESLDENKTSLKVGIKLKDGRSSKYFFSVLDIGVKFSLFDETIKKIFSEETRTVVIPVQRIKLNFFILSDSQLIEERKYYVKKYNKFKIITPGSNNMADRAFLKKSVNNLITLIGEEEYEKFTKEL